MSGTAIRRMFRNCAVGLLTMLGIAFTTTTHVNAGDNASVQVLGFSQNGSYFAFEQYGTQDGSGFPYSDIFVLDTAKDSWVKPSPFRLTKDINDEAIYNEDAFLSAARSENRSAATALLNSTGIAGKGLTVGHNPSTELSSDPHQMVVTPRNIHGMEGDPITLQLEQYNMPSGNCGSYDPDIKGFRLTLKTKGKTRVLNNDKAVPKSRRCVFDYRIERMLTHFPENAPPVFAILIEMSSIGFEGADRRYIAITGRL